MGYRSDWKIAVEAGPEKITKFREWLQTQANSEARKKEEYYLWSVAETYESILQCIGSIVETGSGVGILFENEFTKCYEPWDLVVEEIQDYCTDNDIAFGYGRLGEEPGDVSLEDNNKGLHIGWMRSLTSPFN